MNNLKFAIKIFFFSPIFFFFLFSITFNQGCVLLIFSHLVVMNVLASNDSLFCVVMFSLLSSSAYCFVNSDMFPALKISFVLEIFNIYPTNVDNWASC
jgi:hypothetical protein